MAAELGPDWESKFTRFEREAAAAASLGQVHRAVLPDGRLVACKLQYPDMPSVVEADLRQLRLAMNLYRRLDNAIQHGDGTVVLAARAAENSILIEVSDSGPGIPEELVPHVFDRGVSVGSSTGLGLALAQQVAREHRGSLVYRSRPGHTVFTLLLPLDAGGEGDRDDGG